MQPSAQLKLPQAVLDRLKNRIEEDYGAAITDHQSRMDRFRRIARRWRNRYDPPEVGDEDASNVTVPLIQWQTLAGLAREITGLTGDDAEIVAVPESATDEMIVRKVSLFMRWRLLSSMRIVPRLTVFDCRRLLFGRAHAYAPWIVDTYNVPGEGEQVWYEGPGFFPLWPDDLIVPAESAETVHDFSWVIRKLLVKPEDLLSGERKGRYTGIKANWDRWQQAAMDNRQRDPQSDEVKDETDLAEGVLYAHAQSPRGVLPMHEWYGKVDAPRKNGATPSDPLEVVAFYLPDQHELIGVQDLARLYPKMRYRRPFVEAALIRDGSYWPMGLGELLETWEEELSANHNLFTDAGELSATPAGFYEPAAGHQQKPIKIEPGKLYPTANSSSIKFVQIPYNPNYFLVKEQACLAVAERVTGRSDQAMGRALDRPNAPRTASGQMMLIEEGNVRGALDMTLLREDLSAVLQHFWQLDCQFSKPETFFRVTEEEAGGLFEARSGFASLTSGERFGRYDFRLKFATSQWRREALKQEALTLYQLALANPLVAQNPRALWVSLNRLHAAFGDSHFAEVIPEPPDLDQPKNPKEEWMLMLQGEEVTVNPADHDDLHLMRHNGQLEDAVRWAKDHRDEDAIRKLAAHVLEHQDQKRQKMAVAALTERLTQQLAQNTQTGQGLQAMGGMPLPMAHLQGTLGGLMGQQPPEEDANGISGQTGNSGPSRRPEGF